MSTSDAMIELLWDSDPDNNRLNGDGASIRWVVKNNSKFVITQIQVKVHFHDPMITIVKNGLINVVMGPGDEEQCRTTLKVDSDIVRDAATIEVYAQISNRYFIYKSTFGIEFTYCKIDKNTTTTFRIENSGTGEIPLNPFGNNILELKNGGAVGHIKYTNKGVGAPRIDIPDEKHLQVIDVVEANFDGIYPPDFKKFCSYPAWAIEGRQNDVEVCFVDNAGELISEVNVGDAYILNITLRRRGFLTLFSRGSSWKFYKLYPCLGVDNKLLEHGNYSFPSKELYPLEKSSSLEGRICFTGTGVEMVIAIVTNEPIYDSVPYPIAEIPEKTVINKLTFVSKEMAVSVAYAEVNVLKTIPIKVNLTVDLLHSFYVSKANNQFPLSFVDKRGLPMDTAMACSNNKEKDGDFYILQLDLPASGYLTIILLDCTGYALVSPTDDFPAKEYPAGIYFSQCEGLFQNIRQATDLVTFSSETKGEESMLAILTPSPIITSAQETNAPLTENQVKEFIKKASLQRKYFVGYTSIKVRAYHR